MLFIRVMLIGNAAAGKTSLLRCLSDNDLSLKSILRQPRLPDTGGATLGIQVEPLNQSIVPAPRVMPLTQAILAEVLNPRPGP